MAYNYLVVDQNGRKAKGGPATGVGPLFSVEKFLVTNALGQTAFSLVADITTTTLLVVMINGVEYDETDDFVRDASANTITFNYTIPKNAKVKIRIFS